MKAYQVGEQCQGERERADLKDMYKEETIVGYRLIIAGQKERAKVFLFGWFGGFLFLRFLVWETKRMKILMPEMESILCLL